MGGGSYNYMSAHSRGLSNSTLSTTMSHSSFRETVFKQSHMSPEMSVKGKIREARDSEEHPESFPIIIALDTTGSMDDIPVNLVKGVFPEIVKNIIDAGIPHPQVCFLGVGDLYCDDAPLQCGQFESSDDLMEKWLKLIYLEQGGGGNGGESYNLAWYFAAKHTSIDSFEKRGKKGVLITIGDEPCHRTIPSFYLASYGSDIKGEITSRSLLDLVGKKWSCYHIQMGNGKWDTTTIKSWEDLIGKDRLIVLPREDYKIIPTITSIICNEYGVKVPTTTNTVEDTKEPVNTKITL